MNVALQCLLQAVFLKLVNTGKFLIHKASALKVRKGPGTKYAQKKFTEMTVSAQSINESRRSTGLAFYLKDIIFTAQEIITVSTKEYWARTPSGYVCLELNGEKYVTKA